MGKTTGFESIGVYLELYVGGILLVIAAILIGTATRRQDQLMAILTVICGGTGLFAGITALKGYWYGHITALGTAIIVIVASYSIGMGLDIMGWISGGNIAAGGLIGILGANKE